MCAPSLLNTRPGNTHHTLTCTHTHLVQTSAGAVLVWGERCPQWDSQPPAPATAFAGMHKAMPPGQKNTHTSSKTHLKSHLVYETSPSITAKWTCLRCPSCRHVPEQIFSTCEIFIYVFVHMSVFPYKVWYGKARAFLYVSPVPSAWHVEKLNK